MPKRYPTVDEKRAQHRAKLDRWIAVAGPNAIVRPIANNTAAGPCAECLKLAKNNHPAATVPLMPLDGCPHPDQCFGQYQAEL